MERNIIFKCVQSVNSDINYGLVPKSSTSMHTVTIFLNICGALIINLEFLTHKMWDAEPSY